MEQAATSPDVGPALDRDRLRTLLAEEPDDLVTAYLFGSFGRGEERATSDVDIGLLYREEPPRTLAGLHLDLEGRLEAAVGREVQVVVLNRAPADLVIRVLRDGEILLDRDRALRLRFEVRRRNEYWDLQPILAEYRRPRP